MTSPDDQTTSSFDSTSGAGEETSATGGLAAQTGAQAQTPSAVDGSDGDLGSAPIDGATGEPSDQADPSDSSGASDGGPGVDDSDSGRGNLDGSTAQEDVRARSLSRSKDSLDYTDSGEAGADSGSME